MHEHHRLLVEIIFPAVMPRRIGARISFREQAANPLEIVLQDGCYSGSFAAQPAKLQLLDDLSSEGVEEVPEERVGDSHAEIGLATIFEEGVPIADSGEVRLVLTWTSCHRRDPPPGMNSLYNGHEHQLCGEHVGCPPGGLQEEGALVKPGTMLLLDVASATYGQIIGLAGDYFAFFDRNTPDELRHIWPDPEPWMRLLGGEDYRDERLLTATQQELDETTQHFDSLLRIPERRRFLALAANNFCHFAAHPSDGTLDDTSNLALQSYRAYHQQALRHARNGFPHVERLHHALAIDAFGAHFLTDLFASGHLRVPRRVLQERLGLICGGLLRARKMHDEDNDRGLLVTTRHAFGPRLVWRTYGDGKLETPDPHYGLLHLAMVQESVRRSAAEVIAVWRGEAPFAEAETAEALLPVPLPPGEAARPTDRLPDPCALLNGSTAELHCGSVNHGPMYLTRRNGAETILYKRCSAAGEAHPRYESIGEPAGAAFSL